MQSIKKMLLGIVLILVSIYLLTFYIGSDSTAGSIVIFLAFALLPVGFITSIVGFFTTEDKEDE